RERRHLGQPRHRRPAGRGPARRCRRVRQHARPRQGNAMTASPGAAALLTLGLAVAAPALAQSPEAAPQHGSLAACAQVEIDVDRLACYDRVAGRRTLGPARADAAAALARQNREAASQAEAAAATPAARARDAANDLFASEPDDAIANAGQGSLLDSRWELAKDSKLGTFNFRAYKPVYLLPAFWSSDQNETPHSPNPRNTVAEPLALDAIEAKFQVSFKTKAWENLLGDNGDIWMGYTQSSRWQVYNGEASRPFRETNYEPEVLLVFRNNYQLGGWKGRMAAVGINHQSNGRADPLSRSWNRVMFNVGLDREDWAVTFRPWIRIS